MNEKELRVGFVFTGSFCTYDQVFPALAACNGNGSGRSSPFCPISVPSPTPASARRRSLRRK